MAYSYTEYSDDRCGAVTPVVSVVMPTYNHERYLREAIEGVVSQQADFPFELIIGEDCSADSTRAIAFRYQQHYPHIVRVLTSQNRVGMHENDGRIFSAARGRYMAFCEGDDFWHRPDKLRRQVALLESDPRLSLVCSSWRTVSEDGIVLNSDVLGLDRTRMHRLDLSDILVGRIKTVTVCTRTHIVHRALKESPLCIEGRYPFGDAPLWVEAGRDGECICLPDDYATYRLSRGSVTRPRNIMDVYRFIAGSCEFNRDVLGLYSLPQGEKAALDIRILATRKRLRALALLGESAKVREELQWLSRLGAHVRMREYLYYLGSVLSQPGTFGATSRRWALTRWHALTHRTPHPYTPGDTTQRVAQDAQRAETSA